MPMGTNIKMSLMTKGINENYLLRLKIIYFFPVKGEIDMLKSGQEVSRTRFPSNLNQLR